MAEPTQMIILSVPANINLDDKASVTGKIWSDILSLMREQPGFRRLYWGRQVETPENVQLHIVRGLLSHHHTFLSSPSYTRFLTLLTSLVPPSFSPSPAPTIRHALISTFSPSCLSLGRGAPVTGTAIYLSCDTNWEQAWAHWVSIVQSVPGFLGIAGGPVLEAVEEDSGRRHSNGNGNGGGDSDSEGKGGLVWRERCFVALVGWENVRVHEEYHHTRHFRERRGILLGPAKGGFVGYGHIAFGGSSEGEVDAEEWVKGEFKTRL